MRALLDVNVLLAAFDPGHIHHERAMRWWVRNGALGWATCPLTENGFLRIISQPSYQRPVPLPDALATLRRQIAEGGHEFWPDDVSVLNAARIDYAHLLGPRQITDVYLLGLAVKHVGRLVTFDRGLPHRAVRSAEPRHLVVI